jgi:chemotaxis protein methyltransferase WspC
MSVGAAVRALLRDHVGFSPATLGDAVYDDAIETRLRTTGLSQALWYEKLQRDPSELDALVEALVVPETWFFRDENPFVELARHALKRAPDPRTPLRVLSLPCASGEETYSIAIALREAGLQPSQFRVDGIDVSTAALSRAAAGLYRSVSFRSPRAEASKQTWFVPSGDQFALVPSARESVSFQRGNALDSKLLRGAPPYDVIFCRNLLIYFDRAARESLVATLRSSLTVGGLLFVGHAESLTGFDNGLRRLPDVRAFGYERIKDGEAVLTLAQPPRLLSTQHHTKQPAREHRAAVPVGPSPSSVAVPAATSDTADRAHDPLGAARALANQGALAEARTLVEEALSSPSADAFHLLGMICQEEGRFDEAERCLTRAIYLDSEHYASLVNMALLRERRGDPSAAQFRARASRQRMKSGES